jgi:thiol-disulfide isomerase/thioredoxin
MGRLPLVTLVIVAGCNDPAKPSQGGRSEAVVSSASTSPSTTTSTSTSASHVAAPKGPVCDTSVARSLPKSSIAFVDAAGGVSDKAAVPWASKRAQWISFFASWCGPCKEEIPRIRDFAKRLDHDGVPIDVTFVSIDDDLRQLTAFFAQQPETGLKTSYWLKDGPMRANWMAQVKLKSDPPLPEHAIFDAKSKLRCFVAGAVEDGDYQQIAASLK